MKKRIVSILLVALLVAIFTASANADSREAVVDARNGVVRVLCDGQGTGTGFAIGEEGEAPIYFVTNNHVIERDPSSVYIIFDEALDENGNFKGVPATVVKNWASPDLAILKIENTIESGKREVLPLGSESMVDVTDEIFALGFPGVADVLNDEGYNLPSDIEDITVTTGTVTKKGLEYYGAESIGIDATINHGNSGGPLINADGVVVGVNTFGLEGDNGALYIDYITAYLDENGFDYYKASDVSSSAQTDTPQDTDEPATGVETPAVEPVETAQAGNSTTYIIIGAAIIAIAGGAFFIIKKKNSQVGQSSELTAPVISQAVERTSVPSGSFKLVGEKGLFAGKEFSLEPSVNIGRDSKKCNIIFPSNTAGVSSLHCRVSANPTSVTLTDLGSTYGTYLKGGQKIEANKDYTLQKGDCFYIANSDIKFVIK